MLLPAQLLRRSTTVWGQADINHPGEGAGYEGILAAMLILVLGGMLVSLWICLQKWRLGRRPYRPEGYEEYEHLEHDTEKGLKLLFVASQIAAPFGALGGFVLGDGYELLGFGLPTWILVGSLIALFAGIFAWHQIGRLRQQLVAWRRNLQLLGGD